MGALREVGTLWIGGRLSWMEQLCLKSFVDAGQRITLFHYEPIPNVPRGVICRDGREVIDTTDFLKYEKKNSYALFADLFRLHMIRANPGMVWIDTDVYCHKPLDQADDHVFGFELPDSDRVNNAVLGLPHDSPMLAAMLAFTEDRYPIPPFLPPRDRRAYAAARDAGQPVHVSRQPWGVWGPLMLTHYVRQFALTAKASPMDAFYPVPFPDRTLFNRSAVRVAQRVTERTTALHVWASNKRELGHHSLGLPPEGSWWAEALKRHGINPALAPIAGRNRTDFDAALLDHIAPPGGATGGSVMDLGGSAPSLAISLHARDGCDICVVDIDAKGRFGKQPEAMAAYRARLMGHGVAAARISTVSALADLPRAPLILTLNGFGDTAKVKHLGPVLDRALMPGGVVYADIRKGSGGYPFLRGYGTIERVDHRDDTDLHRVRLTAQMAPGRTDAADTASTQGGTDDWPEIARGLAGQDGFFLDGPSGHSFLHVPRTSDVLVVTFDNLDIAMTKRADRRPWGYEFIARQGWSMLGVLAGGWSWYREPWVAEQFLRLRDEGFFSGYRRAVFYGASMGGYAAAAFSAACPGADVVAISPQSTLDRELVPWETRYRSAWGYDYSGPFGDAAKVSAEAARVTILYDPYERLDAGHVERFTQPNVVRLRCPLMGHRLGSSLAQMGVLSPLITAALAGNLTEAQFYGALRARRDFPRYQKELFNRAIARGRPDLARRVAAWVLARGPHRAIRRGLAKLEAEAAGS